MKLKIFFTITCLLLLSEVNAQNDTLSSKRFIQKGLIKYPNDKAKQHVLALWYSVWDNFSKAKNNETILSKFLESKYYGSYNATVCTVVHLYVNSKIEKISFSKNMPDVLSVSIESAIKEGHKNIFLTNNLSNTFNRKNIIFITRIQWSLRNSEKMVNFTDNGDASFSFLNEDIILTDNIVAPVNVLIAPVY